MSSLTRLIRSIQTTVLSRFNSIGEVKENLAKYNGQDWQEILNPKNELVTLYKDADHYSLELLSLKEKADQFRLSDNRQYVIRVMDGAVRLKTPLTGFEKNLFPSSEMMMYYTKNPSLVESIAATQPSSVLMYHRKL